MSKSDLYPQLNSSPAAAFVQTGTKSGQKGAADVYLIGGVVGSPAAPSDYDTCNVTYPSATSEVYTFLKSSVTIKVVTVTYTTSAKTALSSVTIA